MQVAQLHERMGYLRSILWDFQSSEQDLKHLKKELSSWTSELEVLRLLQATRTWLCNHTNAKMSSIYQHRSTDFLKGMNDTNAKPRFQRLFDLDMKEILFIAATYTALGFNKLPEDVFRSLLSVVPKFLSASRLPSRWALRSEFQIAVAIAAPPGSVLKKSMSSPCSHNHLD